MKAEILSIGTELMLGQIVDTNAAYIAQQLPTLGIDLLYISQVGDNMGRLTETLSRALERSDLIFCTGGLGPTEDDLTREAIAAVLGEEMTLQPDLLATIEAYFARRGRPMTANNRKQATLIPSARAIPNPVGTAPAWWVETQGKVIVALPGVPREMYYLWENEVAPRLRQRVPGAVIVSRTLKVLGLGEAQVEEQVKHLMHGSNPSVGIYAKTDGIHFRLTAKAATETEARAMISELEAQFRAVLGTYIYGADNDTPQSVLADLLRACGKTVGTAEWGCGGYLANTLTDNPSHSDVYRGGLVLSSLETWRAWLGDPDLTEAAMVSAAGAKALAGLARSRTGAAVGLSVAVQVYPGGAETPPPGTFHIALLDGETSRTVTARFAIMPADIKRWAALGAINLLRLYLLSH